MGTRVLHISPQPERIFDEYPRRGVDVAANLEREFRAACAKVCMDTICAARGVPPPEDAAKFEGVVITGSVLSVYNNIPWLRDLRNFVSEAISRKIPVLGICFGHQLIADMYGGAVMGGGRGKELGMIPVDLTAGGMRDALYLNVDQRPYVMSSHGDVVSMVPRGATLLAKGDTYDVQSLAIGSGVRTVQFHPEFDPDTFDALLEVNPPDYGDLVPLPSSPSWRVAVKRTGSKILRNFMEHFILRREQRKVV